MTIGKVIVGGVGASIILWILMQYDKNIAWLYLASLFLGIALVYKEVIFTNIITIFRILGVNY